MGPGVAASLSFATTYVRTRLQGAIFTDRISIERWQARRIEALRRHAISNTWFYGQLGDVPFSDFPIVSKSDVMSAFEAFNVLGLTAAEAWRLLESSAAPKGYDLGCSTGTSGNRGLYLVSDRERFMWLGAIVAKALPDILSRRHRVAVVLPRASRLYDAANESRLIALKFFDLGLGLQTVAKGVSDFDPTIVVSPPKVLRWMAEQNTLIKPERLFSCAEVLDAPDRAIIESAYGVQLGQIYMATEGLLGVSCSHGTVHLAEDSAFFEYENIGEKSRLVSPIVTDFSRRTQVLARYRMNDLLRLTTHACPCGSALQAVAEIVGRCDDCFQLLPSHGIRPYITVTPDVLRNAVLGTDRTIDDFRVHQTGANTIDLVLPVSVPDDIATKAQASMLSVLTNLGTGSQVNLRREPLRAEAATKLRRIERRWTEGGCNAKQ